VTSSEELFQRARALMPGGVNSPVRAFGSVGGTPPFMVSGRGPYLTDADGREYVDLVCSWGPALLGHAHPEVLAAVHAAVDRGLSFGASTPAESDLAELVTGRVGAVERLRMVSTGTEATMTAVRLARGFTGRNLVVKFAGCYHGHLDGLLAAAGSGVATLALPGSAGVTAATAAETLVLPYNDIAAVEEAFATRGQDIAAVITEAAPANMGVVEPGEGFNAALSRITTEHGALLIVDEVQTGLGRLGTWFAFQQAGITPDVITLAKGLGGGLPLGACIGVGAVGELMKPGQHGTTFGGNPVCCAAGLAVLRTIAADGLVEHAAATGKEIATGVEALDHPLVTEVRGSGLLLAIGLTGPVSGAVAKAALDAGYLVNNVQQDSLRLAPPLILDTDQVHGFLDALPGVLDQAQEAQ